jgi:hypothetical protein
MDLRESILKVLREELKPTPSIRRRVNFDEVDKAVKRRMVSNFKKNEGIERSIDSTLNHVVIDVMPEGFEDDNVQYHKIWHELKSFIRQKYIDELRQYFEKRQIYVDEDKNSLGIKYIFVKHDKPYYNSGWRGFAEGFDSFDDMITKYGNWIDVDWVEVKQKLDNIKDFPENTFTGRYNSAPLRISRTGDEGNTWGYNFSVVKSIPKENLDKILKEELGEYSRSLKNARKQGSGLRFPKTAIKNNPLRFRPYSRETVEDSDPKVGTGKKPEGSGRRLYTDENPNDTVSVKFRTKEDIIDTLNKESFKSKSHKRQSQIINLIHQRVRAAYQNAKDPDTKSRLKRALDYIEKRKEESKEKTIRLQKQEQNESELTERCWPGYEKKGMKTMFGKSYPNCVKKTK